MIALGFGKFARADRIFALEPLSGEERGDGRRTRVWVEGIAEPIIASRTEGTILRDMGQEQVVDATLVDEALDLASRLAKAADVGPGRPERPRPSGPAAAGRDHLAGPAATGLVDCRIVEPALKGFDSRRGARVFEGFQLRGRRRR